MMKRIVRLALTRVFHPEAIFRFETRLLFGPSQIVVCAVLIQLEGPELERDARRLRLSQYVFLNLATCLPISTG
jgi:hypothetical protein